jgi:hypothetical protein
MKKYLIYIALFCLAITTNAQFYSQAGFVFYNNNNFAINNYAPFGMPYSVPLPLQNEGYSQLNDTVCPNTPVIFSTNGTEVYKGSDGTLIPGTTGLFGSPNSTKAATIVPISGSRALIITTKNYLSTGNEAYFSLLSFTGTGTCPTYTFNMPAVTKNVQINLANTGSPITSFSEKVTVIPVSSSTSNDYWLIMHEASNAPPFGSDRF